MIDDPKSKESEMYEDDRKIADRLKEYIKMLLKYGIKKLEG